MIPGTDGECPGLALGMRLEPSSESRSRQKSKSEHTHSSTSKPPSRDGRDAAQTRHLRRGVKHVANPMQHSSTTSKEDTRTKRIQEAFTTNTLSLNLSNLTSHSAIKIVRSKTLNRCTISKLKANDWPWFAPVGLKPRCYRFDRTWPVRARRTEGGSPALTTRGQTVQNLVLLQLQCKRIASCQRRRVPYHGYTAF